jgi:hypothetical protein
MNNDSLLERVVVGLALGAVAVVVVTATALFSPAVRRTVGLGAGAGPAYVAGDLVDVPPGLYNSRALTVLIFARSDCDACQRAAPAFAGLISRVHSIPGVGVILVVSVKEEDAGRGYAAQIGLQMSDVAKVDLGRLRLVEVPTVVLVDRQGHVLGAWKEPADSALFVQSVFDLVAGAR